MRNTGLRQLIREMLLTEAAYTPEEAAAEGIRFKAVRTRMGNGGWAVSAKHVDEWEAYGEIRISLPLGSGKCLGAYEVNQSIVGDDAPHGLGPLLYDIAMELTGPAGLMSDRLIVSGEARRVWKFYHDNRPDVDHEQMDSRPGTLTPDFEEDDCNQSSSREDGKDWKQSPLSKVYRKRGTPTIDRLRALGIIEIV